MTESTHIRGDGNGRYAVELRGDPIGTVHREKSSVARNVSNMGGVTRWVGTTLDGRIITPMNTYRRMDAVDDLIAEATRGTE